MQWYNVTFIQLEHKLRIRRGRKQGWIHGYPSRDGWAGAVFEYSWVGQRIKDRNKGKSDGLTNRPTDRQMDGQTDGQMD